MSKNQDGDRLPRRLDVGPAILERIILCLAFLMRQPRAV